MSAPSANSDANAARPAAADFTALRLQADRAFKKVAKAGIVDNDALGIATHGAVRGRLTVRAPAKRRQPSAALSPSGGGKLLTPTVPASPLDLRGFFKPLLA